MYPLVIVSTPVDGICLAVVAAKVTALPSPEAMVTLPGTPAPIVLPVPFHSTPVVFVVA